MESPLVTVTANRTRDGAVAYVARGGSGWTADLASCFRTTDKDEAERVLAWAKTEEGTVCDPYVMPVISDDGALRAQSTRERIRAGGPAETLQRLGYGA